MLYDLIFCICSQNNELEGLITVKDIANANLAIFDSYILSHAHTPYANILDTLSADLIVGEVKKAVSKGRICVSVSQDTPHSGKHQGDVVKDRTDGTHGDAHDVDIVNPFVAPC